MITILLFRRIFTLSTSPSNTLRDLIVTVALYFDIHTDSAEHEVERILEYIRHFFQRYQFSKHQISRFLW